jgi:SAM-dependent methyltransferase
MDTAAFATNWWLRKLRFAIQAYAPAKMKQRLWNREFSAGQWNCLGDTQGDPVYPVIEKYAENRSILDLGCGSGSTANELAPHKYREYIGVDISDEAITIAAKRTLENGRTQKSNFFQSDILSFVPTQKYGVILLRDSIYYVPFPRIKAMLDRYAENLEPDGVFVVRMRNSGKRVNAILDLIETSFQVREKYVSVDPLAVVIVFR